MAATPGSAGEPNVRVRVLEARVESYRPDLTVGLRLPLTSREDIRYTSTLPSVVRAAWADPVVHYMTAASSGGKADFLEVNAFDGDHPDPAAVDREAAANGDTIRAGSSSSSASSAGKKSKKSKKSKAPKFKDLGGCEVHFAEWRDAGPHVAWFELRKRLGPQKYDMKSPIWGEVKLEIVFVSRGGRAQLDGFAHGLIQPQSSGASVGAGRAAQVRSSAEPTFVVQAGQQHAAVTGPYRPPGFGSSTPGHHPYGEMVSPSGTPGGGSGSGGGPYPPAYGHGGGQYPPPGHATAGHRYPHQHPPPAHPGQQHPGGGASHSAHVIPTGGQYHSGGHPQAGHAATLGRSSSGHVQRSGGATAYVAAPSQGASVQPGYGVSPMAQAGAAGPGGQLPMGMPPGGLYHTGDAVRTAVQQHRQPQQPHHHPHQPPPQGPYAAPVISSTHSSPPANVPGYGTPGFASQTPHNAGGSTPPRESAGYATMTAPGSRAEAAAAAGAGAAPQHGQEEEEEEERSAGSEAESQRLMERWKIVEEDLSIERELGRGAYGVAYYGKWRGQEVAIKRVAAAGEMTDDERAAFAAEAALMADLRPHKNIVQLLGFVRDPLSIVMTFYPNGTLENYLKSPQEMRMSRALEILIGICAGMTHLHAEKVIHRDLAARNVLLTATFEPVVADYGLSRHVAGSSAAVGKTQSAVGPLKWMALESLTQRKYSRASDVWMFGVCAWETITRRLPFDDIDDVQAAYAVRDGRRLEVPNTVSPTLADCLRRCWMVDPQARPGFTEITTVLEAELEARRRARAAAGM